MMNNIRNADCGITIATSVQQIKTRNPLPLSSMEKVKVKPFQLEKKYEPIESIATPAMLGT